MESMNRWFIYLSLLLLGRRRLGLGLAPWLGGLVQITYRVPETHFDRVLIMTFRLCWGRFFWENSWLQCVL